MTKEEVKKNEDGVKAKADRAIGMLIEIDSLDFFEEFKEKYKDIKKIADVAVVFHKEIREFTAENFLKKLGFIVNVQDNG